jgi:site-specific recombinase XerD
MEHISFAMDWPPICCAQGASLSEIGELLGHRSPESTKIYIKVDLDALRTLALPWPGGVR